MLTVLCLHTVICYSLITTSMCCLNITTNIRWWCMTDSYNHWLYTHTHTHTHAHTQYGNPCGSTIIKIMKTYVHFWRNPHYCYSQMNLQSDSFNLLNQVTTNSTNTSSYRLFTVTPNQYFCNNITLF